jgi:hypothetical protein
VRNLHEIFVPGRSGHERLLKKQAEG